MKRSRLINQFCRHQDFLIHPSGYLICQNCKARFSLDSKTGKSLLEKYRSRHSDVDVDETLKAAFPKMMLEREIHSKMLAAHEKLCQAAGSTDIRKLNDYMQSRYGKAEFIVTQVYPDGKRRTRFAGCSLEQAETFHRWLQRNEPESQPQVEGVTPNTSWKPIAQEVIEKWLRKQTREEIEKFAISSYLQLTELQLERQNPQTTPNSKQPTNLLGLQSKANLRRNK